jgi:hypothetical protein
MYLTLELNIIALGRTMFFNIVCFEYLIKAFADSDQEDKFFDIQSSWLGMVF